MIESIAGDPVGTLKMVQNNPLSTLSIEKRKALKKRDSEELPPRKNHLV